MNRNFKSLIRKKGRRFKKAKKSGMDEDRVRDLDIDQMVKRELRDAERVYVNGILQNGLESGNNKPFWKYVKSQNKKLLAFLLLKVIQTLNLNQFSLPNLEIHFPSCRVLNAPKLNLYIFLRIVFSCY